MVWSIIGNISNAIAAICAIAAIVVTVWNFKSDRREQKKENLCIKLRDLYKKAVIDSFLDIEDEKIKGINDNLNRFLKDGFDENEMKRFSDYMTLGLHDCLREVETIRIFNEELYREVKQITEKIFDTYADIINKAVRNRYALNNYERKIMPEWIKLRNAIYKCYIAEKFDELEK